MNPEESITRRFLDYMQTNGLCHQGDKILLAVSGGADSMVMARLFLEAGYKVGIAHVNFQLRGMESGRDEEFVKDFAEKQGIPCYIRRFNTDQYARENKLSIEEAARNLRYTWFESVRVKEDYTFTATAHHREDHIETMLMNFFKGTGIRGMHGIKPRQGRIIRPLLFLTKREILDYADILQMAFVEDSSNFSEKHTRNYLRLRIIPALENIFPEVKQNLSSNIQRFGEIEQLYVQAVEEHRKKLVESRGSEIFIPILKLKKSIPLSTIAYEIFRPYHFSFAQSRQIITLLDSMPGKMILSDTHRLIRDRKWLILSPIASGHESITHGIIETGQSFFQAADIELRLEKIPAERYAIPQALQVASLDADKVIFPLIIRRWKQGDYFYPLGMRKKKKISRFFIDEKVAVHEKERAWVIESDKRILWVVGMRIDDRFKIGPSTQQVLKIVVKPKAKN